MKLRSERFDNKVKILTPRVNILIFSVAYNCAIFCSFVLIDSYN